MWKHSEVVGRENKEEIKVDLPFEWLLQIPFADLSLHWNRTGEVLQSCRGCGGLPLAAWH